VDGLWATKNDGVGLIFRAISFQDFQPMWCWSTNVTDIRTDGQTNRRTDRALHYSALRGKNCVCLVAYVWRQIGLCCGREPSFAFAHLSPAVSAECSDIRTVAHEAAGVIRVARCTCSVTFAR